MVKENSKSICKYRSKYLVLWTNRKGKSIILEYEYKGVLSINVLDLEPKIGKFEFVVKVIEISRINLVNLCSFVSDNCVIIHSNIIHTCASWGIFLPYCPSFFRLFCPSSSRFKPDGFDIAHLSVWGVFIRVDRCEWRTGWETPFIVLGKKYWIVLLRFLPLIGIPWLPLRAILCALWPSTHWWLFWTTLRFLLDFHILVGTFCKTIHFCQQKKETLYQIWYVDNTIPVYLCNINVKDQLYFQSSRTSFPFIEEYC